MKLRIGRRPHRLANLLKKDRLDKRVGKHKMAALAAVHTAFAELEKEAATAKLSALLKRTQGMAPEEVSMPKDLRYTQALQSGEPHALPNTTPLKDLIFGRRLTRSQLRQIERP